MTFFIHEHIYRDLASVADRPVTICGVGALGANLAETLARMGLGRLRVIDRDRIEAHNLSTQPWMQQDIGAPKARTLAAALHRAVGARVEPQHAELTHENAERLLSGSAVVVDAFDNLPARAAVAGACRVMGIPCLHIAVAATGDYGCGLWGDAYMEASETTGARRAQSPEPDTCDYPLTRPLALLIAAAAAEALVGQLLGERQRGFELTLRDLRMVSR
jgi:predicted ThiF/HesA family dinucleotide-utilizing enzyme